MTQNARKAAITAYKERTAQAGIYAIRCVPTDQIWVGETQTLDSVQNRLWFSLRTGGDPHRDVQQAWNQHGPDGFTFESLERMPKEDLAFARQAWLKARVAHWRERLGARPI
ncbi:GIY-YIG nuclease family protein [Azospirillum griseum]|uniref:GIY-YIG nuclease family protein n=1 Tax=Azospirillum griseum TaxID=2496639 RepID=A0A3S0KBL9_9PROT|nr:GIY-YIG nuclease family protein [Azospirillum griseum]RTR20969.1 GIY-YIG nuclease family protein [Azospirillum griseum]